MKKLQNIRFYIQPLTEIYGEEARFKITEAFKTFKPDTKSGQLGGGTEGLMPALAMTLITGISLIGGGFLNAIGEDVYKQLKSGILKIVKIKPKRNIPSLPPDYKGEVYTHLLCWIYFEDTQILIELDLKTEQEVQDALNKLPKAIDLLVENTKFMRLFWNGKEWIAD